MAHYIKIIYHDDTIILWAHHYHNALTDSIQDDCPCSEEQKSQFWIVFCQHIS